MDTTHPLVQDVANREVRIIVAGHVGSGKTAIARILHDALRQLNCNANIEVEDPDGDFIAHRTPSQNSQVVANLLGGGTKVSIKMLPLRSMRRSAMMNAQQPPDNDVTLTAPLKFFDDQSGEEI